MAKYSHILKIEYVTVGSSAVPCGFIYLTQIMRTLVVVKVGAPFLTVCETYEARNIYLLDMSICCFHS